jgi:hypothetical protein
MHDTAIARRGIGSCKHEARRGKTRRRQYCLLFGLAPTSRRHRMVAGGGVLVRICRADF